MNISKVSKLTGVSAKTIRYYESVGLVAPAERGVNGYRQYQNEDLSVLKFLSHARQVGFSLEECQQLLALYRDPKRRSEHVKALVLQKLDEVDQKLDHLHNIKQSLTTLADQCAGDEGPDCAIIATLAKG